MVLSVIFLRATDPAPSHPSQQLFLSWDWWVWHFMSSISFRGRSNFKVSDEFDVSRREILSKQSSRKHSSLLLQQRFVILPKQLSAFSTSFAFTCLICRQRPLWTSYSCERTRTSLSSTHVSLKVFIVRVAESAFGSKENIERYINRKLSRGSRSNWCCRETLIS